MIGARFQALGIFLLLAAAVASAQEPVAAKKKKTKPLPEGVEVVRDLVYAKRETGPLHLDLYRPEGHTNESQTLPVVIWVHGGGWKNGSRTNCPAAFLAARGFAVASVEYRLTDKAGWPAQLDDCRDSVRWLRSQAEKHGLQGDRIGVWGSSAGGHLVALMGTAPFPEEEKVSAEISAVCDWFGPSDLLTMPPNMVGNGRTEADVAASNGALLLRGTVKDQPAKARSASAFHQVGKGAKVPFLIMHGAEDPNVPLIQSQKLHRRLQEAEVPSTLIVVPGAKHGGPEFKTEETLLHVEKFFRLTLGGEK